jgi:hypothetical protein
MRRAALFALVALALTSAPAVARTPLPQCAAVAGVNDRCERWSATVTAVERIAGMVVAPRGDLLYTTGTGTRADNGASTIVVTATTTSGKPRWTTRAPSTLPTYATGIAASRDGKRVYVSGFITLRPNINSFTFDYFYTEAIDAATGRVLWVSQYPGVGANYNRALAVAVAPNGATVYVTGFSQRLCSICQVVPSDFATVAYSARTGKPLWVYRYSGLQGGQNTGVSIAVSPDSRRVFVTGQSERPTLNPTPEYDIATVAYRASDGAQQWVRRYSSGLIDNPVKVLVAPNGGTVYVAGTGADKAPGGASPLKYAVLAYAAATGKPKWSVAYRDVAGTDNVLTGAALSPKGDRLYVTGRGQQHGSSVPADASIAAVTESTVAFATASGKRLWAATFAPAGEPAFGTAIAVSPNSGHVYVAGILGVNAPLAGPTGWPVTTSYAASSGKLEWTARYDARDPGALSLGAPVSVAVAPDGKSVYEVTPSAQATTVVQGSASALLLGFAS